MRCVEKGLWLESHHEEEVWVDGCRCACLSFVVPLIITIGKVGAHAAQGPCP